MSVLLRKYELETGHQKVAKGEIGNLLQSPSVLLLEVEDTRVYPEIVLL